MRAKCISVTDLFGVFDHTIPMNLDERITIIHGPNGFGKTVLLRMVDGLFNSRYGEFRSVPFKEFRIQLDDKSDVWVTRANGATKKPSRRQQHLPKLIFNYSKPGTGAKSYTVPYPDDVGQLGFPLVMLEHEIPELDRVGPSMWRHIPTGEILTMEEVLDRYGEILTARGFYRPAEEGTWLRELRSSVQVRFIQTQRLIAPTTRSHKTRLERQESLVPTVNRYSEDLAGVIQSNLAEYAALSQSLDRSFPQRLVMQKRASVLAADDVAHRLKELELKRSSLMEIGLLDKEQSDAFQIPSRIDETKTSVLSVYVQDVEDKLKVFDDVAARIKLFSEIIGDRFLYKRMLISKENGFIFQTSKGDPLPPSSLSSGEQHELVMLYELLFKMKPDSLVLIDEPELSLHIAWQEQFLKDLVRITQLSNFDVLISTHSPQIISDRWDLTVELKRPPL